MITIFKALICFGSDDPRNYCEVFDGSTVETTFTSVYPHNSGGLGLYNGQPTTVGSRKSEGYQKVETLEDNGWATLSDFPE